ncbi:fatty-acyl-CoA synthase [Xylaria intraflava]|nr:fatty-acyl-CoA synthase [Xylaria intraflava]
MSFANIAGAAVGALAAGMYLDARFLIRNDLSQGSARLNAMRGQRYIAELARKNMLTVYDVLAARAPTPEGDNTCLIFEDRQWTYREFYDAIQPIANWLIKDLGVKKGEVVALDGGNTPEYLMIIFAVEAIGATVALLNCNLTGNSLAHCVKLAKPRHLLADKDVENLVSPIEAQLTDEGIKIVYYSQAIVKEFKDTEPLPKDRRMGLNPVGQWAMLYTSGTTGLPKGVVLSRVRTLFAAPGIAKSLSLKPGDCMYTCLPLYHASALVLCAVPFFLVGYTVALGRKFSHSTFWPEVHASGATHIQYVGELCRYLVNAPPSPLDRGHKVRMTWGNGMRSDVWERFRERFGIECINELYAASDGMLFMSNANRGDFTRDSIGVRGPLWHLLNGGQKRVLVDPDTQEVTRNKDGWAIEANSDQVGEIISQMDTTNPDQGTPQYINNRAAILKRRVANVFRKGDLWFRSGDLFREDSDGRLFFVDRLGDTFRWHSENVSTNEVSDVVGEFRQVAETNVYGVLVPNADGRAGCAAIVPTAEALSGTGIDFAALAAHCLARLPRYAVPLFLRVTRGLDYTGTHKMQKQTLRTQGIDLAAIKESSSDDQMYWLPPSGKAYVPFTEKDLAEIKGGRVRL